MSEETSRSLTPDDPVTEETLKRFDELDSARIDVAIQLLNIEQEKVRLLGAAHQVDVQRQRMFEKVLVDRGLDPNTRVTIDSNTGVITVLPVASSDRA